MSRHRFVARVFISAPADPENRKCCDVAAAAPSAPAGPQRAGKPRSRSVIVAELSRPSDIEELPDNNFDSIMVKTFRVGERVSWNSEAGRVRGKVIKVHRRDINYKGYTHHASSDEPLYEIKSDTTDHVALHKAPALRRLGRLRSSR